MTFKLFQTILAVLVVDITLLMLRVEKMTHGTNLMIAMSPLSEIHPMFVVQLLMFCFINDKMLIGLHLIRSSIKQEKLFKKQPPKRTPQSTLMMNMTLQAQKKRSQQNQQQQ